MNLHQSEQRNTVQGLGFLQSAWIPLLFWSKMFWSRGPDSTIRWVLVIEENDTHSDKTGQGTLHQASSLLCVVRREGIHLPPKAGGEQGESVLGFPSRGCPSALSH